MNALFAFLAKVLLACVLLGLLLLAACVALLSVLWSLVRGKRPAMFTVFHAFRQAARPLGQRPAAAPWTRPVTGGDDVVDVQAHEVRASVNVLAPRSER